ncbi:hypothetical protein LOZ58_003446 [Ophidiomyces ophidiicola]|nr:hypothetical protein LOZ65_002903 [Ophidiomyces ophidiicola]KAI1938479.1 hypothetical protein LOZ66_003282 [Ophidiomyces ophidiicola]KAI1960960.1 hypothetical protein LOZ58_003446 [Ophidiomyces ophidiicola]
MGSLCSKSSNSDDHFAQPGRPLGNSGAQPTAARIPVPKNTTTPASQGGRVLGNSSDQPGGSNVEARSAAARAAEERAAKQNAASTKGKLGSQLAAQKAKTQGKTLNDISQAERASRATDAAETSRRWE